MTNQNIDKRREELEEMATPSLKSYFKDNNLENPAGYWKMTKEQMINTIIDLEQNTNDEQSNSKSEEVKVSDKDEFYASEAEVKVVDDENKDNRSDVRRGKYIFKAIDPDGNVKIVSEKLNDIVEYSMSNGIASRGWVALSISREIPVLIGLGRDQEITDDFVPRTTSKYSGNYWRFTKEEIKEEEK